MKTKNVVLEEGDFLTVSIASTLDAPSRGAVMTVARKNVYVNGERTEDQYFAAVPLVMGTVTDSGTARAGRNAQMGGS